MPTKVIQTIHPLSIKGTTLPVGGRSYHFTPNMRGDYVAEVMDEDVDVVLSISEGYQIYEHDDRPLAGHAIIEPPEVRMAADRAVPTPPRSAGPKPGFGRVKHDAQE